MLMAGILLSSVGLFAFGSDGYLKRQFPSQVLELRNKWGQALMSKIWNGLMVLHLGEASYTLLTCLHRGWYSPLNIVKWTLSSLLFGVGSLQQLKKHAKDVAGLKSD